MCFKKSTIDRCFGRSNRGVNNFVLRSITLHESVWNFKIHIYEYIWIYITERFLLWYLLRNFWTSVTFKESRQWFTIPFILGLFQVCCHRFDILPYNWYVGYTREMIKVSSATSDIQYLVSYCILSITPHWNKKIAITCQTVLPDGQVFHIYFESDIKLGSL